MALYKRFMYLLTHCHAQVHPRFILKTAAKGVGGVIYNEPQPDGPEKNPTF